MPGTAALKAAIIAKFDKENGLRYRPEEVIAGSGAKQLIFNALLATVAAGDEVLVPAPYWVSYPDMVALADGQARIIPCSEASGWKLSAADLAAAITPATRWLILNSPNNPTGAVYRVEELKSLAAVLLDAPQVLIMADDIYEHMRHDAQPFATLAQVEPRLHARTLTVNGLSKGYSMTGWRLGYAGGPAWLIAAMQILQSQSTSNPSSISQAAVMAMISEVDGLSAALPPGAFYVFANCQGLLGKQTPEGAVLDSDVAVADYLVQSAHVATLQGSAFGTPGYLRIAYAIDDKRLEEACTRIGQACARLR